MWDIQVFGARSKAILKCSHIPEILMKQISGLIQSVSSAGANGWRYKRCKIWQVETWTYFFPDSACWEAVKCADWWISLLVGEVWLILVLNCRCTWQSSVLHRMIPLHSIRRDYSGGNTELKAKYMDFCWEKKVVVKGKRSSFEVPVFSFGFQLRCTFCFKG